VSTLLIYGATGYTGKLLAQTAKQRNLPAIVAGRNQAAVTALAQRLGLEGRTASLDQSDRLDDLLRGVAVLLNAAGPFAVTAPILVEACLRTGTHYLDVAGEIGVFERLHRCDDAARGRGVMLMPGVGINVVASDCLAAHVTNRLPAADRLAIGISRTLHISRGSLASMASLVDDRVVVCRDRTLVRVPVGSLERHFDFGRGPSSSTAMSWPDVFTAHLTTGIANVEAYVQIDSLQRSLLQFARSSAWIWQSSIARALLNGDATLLPEGPSYEDQKTRRRAIVVVAEDGRGTRVCSRLRTPEGYWFTALSALALAERVLSGEIAAGFQTPARIYGADFVLGLDGVYRDELEV